MVTFTDLQINTGGSNDMLVASVGNSLVPTNIANTMVWLDTSDTNTVTGTASVTAIGDKSGNGNNFGTLVNSSGSIAYTNTINGRKVVTYAGGGGTGEVLHKHLRTNLAPRSPGSPCGGIPPPRRIILKRP